MPWTREAIPLVNQARLMHSAPEVVYSELAWYGEHLEHERYSGVEDRELENALLERGDRLIDLGLAKNASSHELVGRLYRRALEAWQSGEGDEVAQRYHVAVRIACLSNRIAPGVYAFDGLAGFGNDELKRLIDYGNDDEVAALVTNPGRQGLLGSLYKQTGVFADMSDARRLAFVNRSVGNPALNLDTSDSNGPDLTAWELQRGVFEMVLTAPVAPTWAVTLHGLLLKVEPDAAATPKSSEEAHAALVRWRGLHIPKLFGTDDGVQSGFYSSLSLIDEFQCLVGALYGRTLGDGKFAILGSMTSEDLGLRCSYYGNVKMTPAEIAAGFQRDSEGFVLATMMNDILLLTPELREIFEPMVGHQLEYRYARRRERLNSQHPRFDVRLLYEIQEQAAVAAVPVPATDASIQTIAAQLAAFRTEVAGLRKLVLWGLVAIIVYIFWRH